MWRLTCTTRAVDAGGDRRLGDLGRADVPGVQERLVRQVEQVVDQQARPGGERLDAVDGRPGRVVEPCHRRQQRRLGCVGVAHPHPHPRPALDQRTGSHVRPRRHPVLARRPHARAAPVEAKAVVAALDLVAHERAGRQRVAAMRAPVVERHGAAVLAPEQHDVPTADRASERLATHLAGGRRDVPVLAGPAWCRRRSSCSHHDRTGIISSSGQENRRVIILATKGVPHG